MMRSLFSGVSGLKNHQTRMDVIGNNISNVNTTGFKSSRVNFTDMLSQNLSGASSPQDGIGGTNPKQIGLGSAVGAVDMLFTNGSVQSTGVNTDLALSGSNTLFVVNTGGGTAYTRNGDFQFDAEGNYVQAGNGYYVQGWMADDKGELPASKTGGNMGNIQIKAGRTMAPAASQQAVYTNNLNSEIPLITKISGGEAVMPTTGTDAGAKVGKDTASATVYTNGGGNYILAAKSGATATDTYVAGDTAVDVPGTNTNSVINSFTPPSTSGTGTETLKVTLTVPGSSPVEEHTAIVTYDGATTKFVDATDSTKVYCTTSASSFSVGSSVSNADGTKSYTISDPKVTNAVINQVTQAKDSYAEGDNVVATANSPVTLKLNDGSTQQVTTGKYAMGESVPIITTLSVYGTEGSVHEVPMYFTRVDAKNNIWRVSLDNSGGTKTKLPDAAETAKRTTVELDPNATTLKFDDHGVFVKGGGNFELTLLNGEQEQQKVSLNFEQVTQYASSSTIAGNADGNAAGTLASIAIDKTGTITGTYTNGMKRTEAQVAVAQFTNPGGLSKVGESLYEESNNSGKPNVNTAASFGATITPSALEMSNVDVANEFTDMIITQRGFQTNSKIITVSDEMLETVVNMKR